MKRLSCLLTLVIGLLASHATHAQVPPGTEVATFPLTVSKLVTDPARPRIYAADPSINSVAVIDTTTLAIIANIPVGPDPVDMSISLDGTALYVANNGSTASAISVIDLGALATTATFSLPTAPVAIACGLEDRVYVEGAGGSQTSIYQLDGSTGSVETTFNVFTLSATGQLRISPDGTRLFLATDTSSATIHSFDVSTATAVALQTSGDLGANVQELVISHHGEYICLPTGGGNFVVPESYSTALLSTADITTYYGYLNGNNYPGPLAFSPDDSLIYQLAGGLQIFSTQSFQQIDTVPLTDIPADEYPPTTTTMVADNTGSYLFLGESAFDPGSDAGRKYRLAVFATGAGTLTPALPTVTVAATVPTATTNGSNAGAITITRTGDLSQALDVVFSLKGSAKNGMDYQHLKLLQKIRPNKASATIHVIPLAEPATASTKTLKLILQPSLDYQLNGSPKAKVKIIFDGQSGPGPL